MFEATLYTADIDRPRLQRLTFAAAIAIAATTAGIASMWTLDQLHIDRISGPSQQFELAQFSMLPPPPVVPPPPPPDEGDQADQKPADPAAPSERQQSVSPDADDSLDADDSPSEIPDPRTIAAPPKQGIPGLGGGCPGGVCQGVAKTGQGGGSPCIGPLCGSRPTSPTVQSGPPKEVEFSALRCLACANPDRAALRKTTAGVQGREGKVSARFCVDAGGRVEANSITISRSYGDAAVDRIVRSTIKGWRFSPMKVGNQARRACSSVSFNIRFD